MGQSASTPSTPLPETHRRSRNSLRKGKGRAAATGSSPSPTPLPRVYKASNKTSASAQMRKQSTTSSFETKIEAKAPRLVINGAPGYLRPADGFVLPPNLGPEHGPDPARDDEAFEGLKIRMGQKNDTAPGGGNYRSHLPRTSVDEMGHPVLPARASSVGSNGRRAPTAQRSERTPALPKLDRLAPPTAIPRAVRSPQSCWSVSSVGEATPPPPLPETASHDVRTSMNLSLNSIRPSSRVSSKRLSQTATRSPVPSGRSTTPQLSSAKMLGKQIAQGFRLRKEKVVSPQKKGPIVIVGAQRVGSNRHSALLKRNSNVPSEYRPSMVGSRRDSMSSHVIASPLIGMASRQVPSMTITRESSPAAEWFDIVDSYADPVTPSSVHTAKYTPRSEATSVNYIAPSPNSTHRGVDSDVKALQTVPARSLARLPSDHPASRYHDRFSILVDIAPPTEPLVIKRRSVDEASEPAAPSPPQPQVRSGSTTSLRTSSPNDSFYQSLDRLINDAFELSEGFYALNPTDVVSGSKLGAEEAVRARLEDVAVGALRKSSSLRNGSSSDPSGSGEVVPLCMPLSRAKSETRASRGGYGRRPSTASQTSFPASVTQTVASTPPQRGDRLGSHASFVSITDSEMPSLPSKPTHASFNAGEGFSWTSYSFKRDSSRTMSSVTSEMSELPSLTFDAFPLPPTMPSEPTIRPFVPRPLELAETRPLSHKSFPSDASTPSTSSFDSSVKTIPPVVERFPVPRRESDDPLEKSVKELESLLTATQGKLGVPSSPTASSVDAISVTTLTWQGGPSWGLPSSAVAGPVRIADSPTVVTLPAVPLHPATNNAPTPTFGNFSLKLKLNADKPLPASPAQISPMTTKRFTRAGSDASSVHSTPEEQRQGFLPFLAASSPLVDARDSYIDFDHTEESIMFPTMVHRIDAIQGASIPVQAPMYAPHVPSKIMRDRYFSTDILTNSMTEFARRDTYPIWSQPEMRNSASEHEVRAAREALVHGRETKPGSEEIDKKFRLGNSNKRGFNKGEIRGWLYEQHA